MRDFNDVSRIKVFLKDPNKKSFLVLVKEVLVLLKVKKEIPFYYFKYLYRKNVKNYLDYLSTGEANTILNSKLLHNPACKTILDNKLFFALLCEKSSLNTPRLISYNLGNNFYFKNTSIQIDNSEELVSFLENVFVESKLGELFFRPPSDYGGKGCFKITCADLKNEEESLFHSLVNGSFVHTEVIKQHEKINKIHDKSVSTLRIVSLITSENHTKIISAFMRFGVGNSVVDNSSSGGFFVGINMNTGTLKKIGHYLPEYGGSEVYRHPDSGFKLEGFEIPYFKEACEEVLKGVKIIPDRFIGWDVAITQNGPIIIEANKGPHLPSVEIGYGGLLQNHHVKQLLEELKK